MTTHDGKPKNHFHFHSYDEVKRRHRQETVAAMGIWLLFFGGLGFVAVENPLFYQVVDFMRENIGLCLLSWFALSILLVLPFGLVNWFHNGKINSDEN